MPEIHTILIYHTLLIKVHDMNKGIVLFDKHMKENTVRCLDATVLRPSRYI